MTNRSLLVGFSSLILLTIAVILKLDIEETEKLLRLAGYSLAKESSLLDSIFAYFIDIKNHSIEKIEEALIHYGLKPLLK